MAETAQGNVLDWGILAGSYQTAPARRNAGVIESGRIFLGTSGPAPWGQTSPRSIISKAVWDWRDDDRTGACRRFGTLPTCPPAVVSGKQEGAPHVWVH